MERPSRFLNKKSKENPGELSSAGEAPPERVPPGHRYPIHIQLKVSKSDHKTMKSLKAFFNTPISDILRWGLFLLRQTWDADLVVIIKGGQQYRMRLPWEDDPVELPPELMGEKDHMDESPIIASISESTEEE